MTKFTQRARWYVFILLTGLITTGLSPVSAETRTDTLVHTSPSWYTSELNARVMAAGTEGVALPVGIPVPASALAFTGIRPGAWMITPNWCTMNFLFNETGAFGSGPYYLGTAKHCVQAQTGVMDNEAAENVIGKPVILLITPTPGDPVRLIQVGTVSNATSGNGSIGKDYALVRIDPALEHLLSPSVALTGGPTSVYRGSATDPIVMTGHGLVLGTGGTARPGILSAYNDGIQNGNGYGMVIPAISGDSGAPIKTLSGAAVGNVTAITTSNRYSPAIAFGTRVSLVQSLWNLNVVTCSSGDPWLYTGCPR